MASADFSGESPRPHGISHTSFIVYSPDLRIRGYGCLWELRCLRPACPPGTRLRIRFLFVEPRFRYCFLSPGSYPRLANRYRVRRQLRPQWTFTTDVGHARHTEKGVISSDTLGGKQELTFVSESGMYALIFQSRKPQARAFRKWVTGEVLPSLRKYGYYVAPGAQLTDEQWEELERVMMGRMLRYLSRRDYIQVARRTGYPVWYVQRVVAGQAGGHAGSVMLALQKRALKNRREYVDPLSEAQMTSVIEQLS